MDRRSLWVLAGMGVLGAGSLAAADISGKWMANIPGRGGQTRETTFVFKQEGAKLSGTMSGQQEIQIMEGKVEGDTVSFSVNMSFGGNEAKILFKGAVSGAEIKFTRQREGGEAREFTAKRAGS